MEGRMGEKVRRERWSKLQGVGTTWTEKEDCKKCESSEKITNIELKKKKKENKRQLIKRDPPQKKKSD